MCLINVQGVVKQLGKRKFGPFTFDVYRADTIAILGPNGVGKSTLLKLLSGAYQPTTGNVLLGDSYLSRLSIDFLSRNRAVLLQSQSITFALTVELVIGLGRVVRPHLECNHQIVHQAAAMLDVSHLLKRSINTLSGGELARVQLARVCAQLWDSTGGFILMDEPIAAVDLGLQDLILNTLMRFARARQHAVIAVVHDLNHALRYFNRLVLLHTEGTLECLQSSADAKHALERLYNIRLSCLVDAQGELVLSPLRNKQHI